MKNITPLIVCLLLTCLVGCQPNQSTKTNNTSSQIPPTEPNTPLAKVLNQRAADLLEANNYEAALPLLQQAIIADPNYAPIHNQLGLVAFANEDWPAAAKHFQRVIQLTPTLPTAYNNIGLIHERIGDLSAAILQYQRAHQLDINSPQFLGNLVRAMHRRGDSPSKLRPLLQELIRIEQRHDWRLWAQEQLALLPNED